MTKLTPSSYNLFISQGGAQQLGKAGHKDKPEGDSQGNEGEFNVHLNVQRKS